NRQQRVAVYGLNKAVTQHIRGGAESANVLRPGDVGAVLSADRTIIDQRAVGNRVLAVIDGDGRVHEVAEGVVVADAQLGNLAGPAHVRLSVAIHAAARVVDRAQAIGDVLFFHKDAFVSGKGRVIGKTVTDRTGLIVVKGSRIGRWSLRGPLCNADDSKRDGYRSDAQ